MQLGSILIFIVWFIRASFQLACIQCTSPVRRLSPVWDHSCLDGTLIPVLCEHPINRSHVPFQNCVSALYRLAVRGSKGIHIHRGCSMIADVRHECEPPATIMDIDTTLDFFCRRTCSEDGCNQHSVGQIFSHARGNFNRTSIFYWTFYIIWGFRHFANKYTVNFCSV